MVKLAAECLWKRSEGVKANIDNMKLNYFPLNLNVGLQVFFYNICYTEEA